MLKSFAVPALFSFFLFFISVAEASHGRYMHTTWQRVSDNQDGSVTVRFNAVSGWRSDGLDILTLQFGDGNSFHPAGGDITNFFEGQDAAGNLYTLRRYIVEHTYSEADIIANDGVFLASHQVCCRVTVLNGGTPSDPLMKVQLSVDLNNGNKGSVVSNAPAILQVETEEVNVLPLPFNDPDGDPVRCRMGTQAESDLPAVAETAGATLEVSENCVLTWDLTDADGDNVGERYAVQVVFEETNRCDADDCARSALDFLIEIVEGPLPVCTINKPVNNNVYVDVPFVIELTGVAGPNGDADYEYFFNGLPDGAEVSPEPGTVQASPFTTTVSWTPEQSNLGESYIVLAGLLDEDNLQNFCSFSMNVQEVPELGCTEIDITTDQFEMDGNALRQRDLIYRASRRLVRLGVRTSLINNVRQRADALYNEAWEATWQIPSQMSVCENEDLCQLVSNQPEIDSYLALVGNLDQAVKRNIRRIRRLGAPRRAVSRLRRQSNIFVGAATDLTQEVPEFRSVCDV